MSRSRSARHKRSPKPETQTKRTSRAGETVTAGSAKNYDYETHFVKSLETAAAAGPEREQGGLLNSRHVLGSHCTALHCTALHCTALPSLHCVTKNIVLGCAVLKFIVLNYTACAALLNYVLLHTVLLYRTKEG